MNRAVSRYVGEGLALDIPGFWLVVPDGYPTGTALYRGGNGYAPHYSCHQYADGRYPLLFVGPGEKMVLVTRALNALFAWRKFKDDSGQQGVNCTVFRNEGPIQSSLLIQEAVVHAAKRWPGERLYTYVSAEATAKRRSKRNPPGYCFLMAGWQYVPDLFGNPAYTKSNQLHILEYTP